MIILINKCVHVAIRYGLSNEIIISLFEKGTIRKAVENGNLELLKNAHENGIDWDEDTTIVAAAKGYLECLKYAHENKCPWNERTTEAAAEYAAAANGHLKCLMYAHENRCP
ncbi:uncharacterized protein LOC126895998 isoform X2 [Daktulosphaira vitifoliae]|uniref:uncharacterized protein LOC126895998 isoform X2 n=1 Tax=Daktulosphaira vitifoliae TaxID=58002 RepID=UPI0021AA11ED|nr:uncharacterized protein LOC126895998 isoform X2 [Daktulosphaira vitifoliae]